MEDRGGFLGNKPLFLFQMHESHTDWLRQLRLLPCPGQGARLPVDLEYDDIIRPLMSSQQERPARIDHEAARLLSPGGDLTPIRQPAGVFIDQVPGKAVMLAVGGI